MLLTNSRSTLTLAIAAAATLLAAAAPLAATNVTYTATGTFASTVVSGSDTFKLANQPFSISIVAAEGTVPVKSGKTYAEYNKLKMTGTVQSGLLPTPTTLSSGATSMELAYGNPSYDVFAMFAPLKILNIQFNITAVIHAPKGTVTTSAIAPFSGPVTLTSSTTTVTYAYTTNGVTNSTTLTIASGTLSTTTSAQTPAKVAQLQSSPSLLAHNAVPALLGSRQSIFSI
jgi:hypothetical protein